VGYFPSEKMKYLVRIKGASTWVALILFFGCATKKAERPPAQGMWLNAGYDLSLIERMRLSSRARSGDAQAAYRLFEYYGFVGENNRKAMKWVEVSARCGLIKGQYSYAQSLTFSRSRKDNEQAVKWFTLVADRGHSGAQQALAELFETGKGTTIDLGKSRELYEKAANLGESTSMRKLVEFLVQGKGGPSDPALAYAWGSLLYKRLEGSVLGTEFLPTLEGLQRNLSPAELERGNLELLQLKARLTKKDRE
jgi:TPR repeat protein